MLLGKFADTNPQREQSMMNFYGKEKEDLSLQDIMEFRMDENGLLHEKAIVQVNIKNAQNNPKQVAPLAMKEAKENNNLIAFHLYDTVYKGQEKVSNIQKVKYSTIEKESFERNGFSSISVDSALNLVHKPNEQWQSISSKQYHPDIVVDQMLQPQEQQQEQQQQMTDPNLSLLQAYDAQDVTADQLNQAYALLQQSLEYEQEAAKEQSSIQEQNENFEK